MNLFAKRICAYIIDFFVVSAFMWILAYIGYFLINNFNMFQLYHYALFVLPVLILAYFTIMEGTIGATVGKRLMFIEVVSTVYNRYGQRSKVSYPQAFVRSLSKIFWIPIVLDVILGKISGNVRILERISRTQVVNEAGPSYNRSYSNYQREYMY